MKTRTVVGVALLLVSSLGCAGRMRHVKTCEAWLVELENAADAVVAARLNYTLLERRGGTSAAAQREREQALEALHLARLDFDVVYARRSLTCPQR